VAPAREVLVHRGGQVQVLGDSEQLRQVLTNLTRNAVVHTPSATAIEITVSSENGRAVIEVRDHGPGVPRMPATPFSSGSGDPREAEAAGAEAPGSA
jgi:signal transduction histidine kinase